MRIWLLKASEPVPTDPGRQRLQRTGTLAEVLTAGGAEVVWWTSSLRHADKQLRFSRTTWQQVNGRLRICFLQTRPYRKSVSLERIGFNADLAREFSRAAAAEPPPDVIFAAYPVPELADAAGQYARQRGIPAVVDIRDLWPDIWLSAVPTYARWAARIGILPFHYRSRQTLRLFDGICGITEEMVEWGLVRAGRERGMWDRPFPLAYAENQYSEGDRRDAADFWRAKLGYLEPAELKLCFFGNFALQRARIDVMIDAMRFLPPDIRARTRLVLCGTGDDVDAIDKLAAGIPQIVLPGWVTGPQIESLALQSHAGILPYPSGPDFIKSIPNKAIEYLAHGLPVLTSLQGPVARLLSVDGCGVSYRETDPKDLAQKIVGLFGAHRRLQELSGNATRAFRKHFLAAEVYGRLARMLEELRAAGALAKPSA